MIEASPSKLRDGTWGVRVAQSVNPGDRVRVRTRAGKTWETVIGSVLWTGKGVSLCSTRASRSAKSSRRSGRSTGCSCGSREDAQGALIYSPNNCWGCNHDA